ncbi:hypothetical protein, partial [Kitasatospora sp. NPDC059571]|uniref:hypothetical protein n=1 Tax=Kitasatospora sp. NPDC059571 TaxID=3346871 RepID=UPI0036A801A9
ELRRVIAATTAGALYRALGDRPDDEPAGRPLFGLPAGGTVAAAPSLPAEAVRPGADPLAA